MINNRQGGRRRGRGPQQQAPRGMSGGGSGNSRDQRQRGNAAQLLEKYKSMARDAQLAGDRVQTEYYLQFADHYFRVLGESRSRYEEQRPRGGRDDEDEDDLDDDGNDGDGEGEDGNDRDPRDRDRNDRGNNDRGNNDRDRVNNDRGNSDRSNNDRVNNDRDRSNNDRDRNDREREPVRARPERNDRPIEGQRRRDRGERFDGDNNGAERPRYARDDQPQQQQQQAPRGDRAERAERPERIERAPERAPERTAERSDERPQRRERIVRPRRDDDDGEPRMPIDLLPPAIGIGNNDPVVQDDEAPAPRRRVRRPRVADGDGEVAPAA